MKKFPVDAWVGIFFMAFAIFVLVLIIPNFIAVPSNVPIASLSPRFWPSIVCGMMLVLGFLQTVVTLYRNREKGENGSSGAKLSGDELAKIAGVIVLLLGYYVAVTYIGFMLSTMLFTPILAIAYGERRILVLALICLVPGPALYFFFSRVAYTIFEPGKLFL